MSEENGFTNVCKYSDLKEKEGKRFFIDDEDIALFKVDGKIYAATNICPHQQSAIIYDGFIEDCKVVCPAHGWEFDLKTGLMPSGGSKLRTFKTKVIGDEVYVKVEKRKLNW